MPELPEVETTRRGIEPHITGRRLEGAVVREARLRWPVPDNLHRLIAGQRVVSVERRAKYILVHLEQGSIIIHLGMSGSLRVVTVGDGAGKHDHVDIMVAGGKALRLRDPRRFGSIHFSADWRAHPLIRDLGPEPLGDAFDAAYLHAAARGRRLAVKEFIMNAHTVVGVGNIYAAEALFRAGIHPFRAAGRISRTRYVRLVAAIRAVLAEAIEQGGTTLRDFVSSEGKPGYFGQSLFVYGRQGEPCESCSATVRMARRGQRATYYCPRCQKN